MPAITLDQAEAQLAAYLAAETKVLAGQSYEIDVAGNRRKLTRADLAEIRAGIEVWNNRVVNLTNKQSGRGRARTVVLGG